MKIYNENLSLTDFKSWSGATETQSIILENNKEDEFDELIEELYPNGLSETKLNDLLWFESDYLFKCLRIRE